MLTAALLILAYQPLVFPFNTLWRQAQMKAVKGGFKSKQFSSSMSDYGTNLIMYPKFLLP